MGSGSKYDIGAYFATQYFEEDGGSVSGFSLTPYVGAYEDMWNATILMDTVQWFFYARLMLFKISPIAVSFTLPNYLVAQPGKSNKLCLSIKSDITFLGGQIRLTANSLKYVMSVTNWLANDMNDEAWTYNGFDDDYEQVGGWMNLGQLWKGDWIHYKICAA
jgi:hypothetical protein